MGCNRASNPPIDPSDPDACPPFLRELWWQDTTQDGTLVDDGDASQAGYPFADQFAQKITPRTLRNFAYEVSRGLCSVQQFIAASDTCCDHIVFFLGDGTNGEDNYLYYSVDDPTPPLSPGMDDWEPLGDLSVDPGTFYPLTGDPTDPAHAPAGTGPGDWGITEDGWVWYIDETGNWQQGPNIQGPQGQAGTGITPKGPTPEPPTGPLLPPGSVGEGNPATNGDAVIVDGAADPEDEGHMWVFIDGVWHDYGELEGPPGPQGPPGATGPTGPTGPKGDPGAVTGLPPGGDPGQALVKSSDLDGEVVWADCCGTGGADCTDLELTPALKMFDTVLVDALPDMVIDPDLGVAASDPLWMSEHGMTGIGSTATFPAATPGSPNHIGQAFNISWSDNAQQDGEYIDTNKEGEISYTFTFTADNPGNLNGRLVGLGDDDLNGSITSRCWPPSSSKVTVDGNEFYVSYHFAGESEPPEIVDVPIEYTLVVTFQANAPIREHLAYDDPSLELLFEDNSSALTITFTNFTAVGRTGEFYDQGVADIDSCYGTDLGRMMDETVRRVPKPLPVSGIRNGGAYGPTNQPIVIQGRELHFNGPAAVRYSDDDTDRVIVDIPSYYALSTNDTQGVIVSQGKVTDCNGITSRSPTAASVLCVVSVQFTDLAAGEFDPTKYLSADLDLYALIGYSTNPDNFVQRDRSSVRIPVAGVWQLPVTTSLAGVGDFGQVTPSSVDWFVRMTLTDPTVDAPMLDKSLTVSSTYMYSVMNG